jgi:uncharacterized membrane protein (DUF2068 family)
MRNWARWLGMISAGIYVPFELYYLFRTPSWTSVSVLSINLAVLWLLWPRRRCPTPTGNQRRMSIKSDKWIRAWPRATA